MEKTQQLLASPMVLVEGRPAEFLAWARWRGAYNVKTGQVMETGLSSAARRLIEHIASEGNNGWATSVDKTLTLEHLRRLAATGEYDRDLILGFARLRHSEESIAGLTQILDSRMSPVSRPNAPRASTNVW